MQITADLTTCVAGLATQLPKQSCLLTGMSQDSRQITTGEAFICLTGNVKHIANAIDAGASAIISDSDLVMPIAIPHVVIPALKTQLKTLAKRMYGDPSNDIALIGITGTNGKSTISYLIAQLLTMMNITCGVIGTLGYGILPTLTQSQLTTPDIFSLNKQLRLLIDKGAKAVAMEVSSHGLDQGRVDGLHFDYAVFSNLTQDHLDYHKTLEKYAAAKRRLFEMPELTAGIINVDDAIGYEWQQQFKSRYKVVSYSIDKTACQLGNVDFVANHIQATNHGSIFELVAHQEVLQCVSPLFGKFNVANLLAAIAVATQFGATLPWLSQQLSRLTAVPGRMQFIHHIHYPKVMVDYAHTPDALAKALSNARAHCKGKLWCLFGCGGNRDTDKRHKMFEAAKTYADQIIITNDNPRFENPMDIICDILQGALPMATVHIETDRARAICYALMEAQVDDVVVIAGKGHENYQEIAGQRHPFSDAAEVYRFIEGYS